MSTPQPPSSPKDPNPNQQPFGAPVGPPAMGTTAGDDGLSIDSSTTFAASTAEKKPSIVGRVGLVLAAVAIAGGAFYAVSTALESASGPASPDEAVELFFNSLDNDDLLGMTEAMLPSERESLVEPTLEMFSELQRLELIDPDFDLTATSEFDFDVEGLEVTTSELGNGVARARVVGGTISVSGDSADLPIGSVLTDLLDEPIPSEPFDEQMVDFVEDDLTLAVVEEDGSWYVSLWYSVAEGIRRETDSPLPDFGNGVEAIGASSPEGAVEGLLNEIVDLDFERSIGMLDPNEFRALYDYAPLFLDDVDREVDDLRQQVFEEGGSWNLDRLDLRSESREGRTVVVVEGFAFSAEFNGERAAVDLTDGCFTLEAPDQEQIVCGDSLEDDFESAGIPSGLSAVYLEDGAITVVERDGLWFVSGVPTLIYAYTDMLGQLDSSDVETMIDDFGEAVEDGFGMFGGLGLPGQPVLGFDEPLSGTESDAADEVTQLEEVEVSEEDRAAFLPELSLYGQDPDWYFGFTTQLVPMSYTTGTDDSFNSVSMARFGAGSGPMLIADLETDDWYEPVDLAGLPDGAVAFEFEDVDVMVVYGDVVVSAWVSDDLDLLVRQVQYLAES